MDLKNLSIVLVEPRHPGNIGSVCRACKNMGISDIILVNPVEYLTDEVFHFGWGAEDLIHSLRTVPTLEEAVSSHHIVVGTTNRSRKNQQPYYLPEELCDQVGPQFRQGQKIALIFGRENNGLTSDELAKCHYLSTIPAYVTYPALNLSQAVMLYAYHWYRYAEGQSVRRYRWKPATVAEQDAMYEKLEEVITKLPIVTRHGTTAFVNLFRRVLGRTQLEGRDTRLFHKLFDLIHNAVNKGDFKGAKPL